MSVADEAAQWFAKNSHRFEYEDPTVNAAEHVALWQCRDGWIVGYSTSRVVEGPAVGKFVTVAYKPTGRGARSGNADRHVMVYERSFSTRRAAKARAESLYDKHHTSTEGKSSV